MLSREVEEGKELLGVVGDLGHRLGPLDAVVGREGVDRPLGMAAVLGPDELVEGTAGAGVDALGQRPSTLRTTWDCKEITYGFGT
jgi:hypothetical protein